MRARAAWIGLGAIALLAVLTFALWPGDHPGDGRVDDEAELDEPYPDDGEWGGWALDDTPPEPPSGEASEGRRARPGDPEWEARRAQWQERWRRAVDIAPLGPADPGIDADSIRDALRPGRDALRACIDEGGGWRALREASRAASRAAEGEPRRRRRSVAFDVRPDGTVDPESLSFEPPVPEAFDGCFRTFFGSARFDGVGADGARVEMPMGGGRGRRRFDGDGGVPMGRWRGRGEWRRERGEGRPGGEGRRGPGEQWRDRGGEGPRRGERGSPSEGEPAAPR